MSVRLTAAQATVAFLSRQKVEIYGVLTPYFAGCWAIFGHGNVAGLGEALYGARETFPTFRAHNEQAMAHAAIAFAKQSRRRRAMVCTTSIGPGATNLVTAAALAHVNRLPVLLLPGDVYASRRPDPVLQQVEDFADATVSANDALRPVSRLFDRITRPEQILDALPRAMSVLLDPAACGPVTLAFCQDVQAEAFDVPDGFLRERLWRMRAPPPEPEAVRALAAALRGAQRPVIVAGGGVRYAGAEAALADLAAATALPVTETQAGKGAFAWDHPANLGGAGVTGSSAANLALAEADLVVGLGTRLQDFTTGSRALVDGRRQRLVQVNVAPHDAAKHDAEPVVADAKRLLDALAPALGDWGVPDPWRERLADAREAWAGVVDAVTADDGRALPTDAQVLGAVRRAASADAVVVCAAGGLPGELHRLWRAAPCGYHVEYGYSCMGYEIAGGLGVKMAEPEREVHVLVGDGSYLMLNSEIATSVMLGRKMVITVLDNHGFGCIDRLQRGGGAPGFNNLLADARRETLPAIDFAAHAAALGAWSRKVGSIAELEAALVDARGVERTCVLVIDTDPSVATAEGGAWWDVARPQVSAIEGVRRAREDYDARTRARDEENEPMSLRLGVSPIAWINDDMPELGGDTPLETVLGDARDIGFSGIELGGRFPREPAALRALLGGYGLDLIGGWYGSSLLGRTAREEIEALQPHLGLLEAMGSTVFVIAETSNAIHGTRETPLSRTPRLDAETWKGFGARLTEVADYIHGRGLRFAYHHHLGTAVEGPADIEAYLANTGGAAGFTVDTGHATLGGVDPIALMRSHPRRVSHVHCKDVRPPVFEILRVRGGSFLDGVLAGMFTTPGDGPTDYDAVMETLREIGYAGWVVVEAEQDPAMAAPRDYGRLGFDTLRRAAARAGLTVER